MVGTKPIYTLRDWTYRRGVLSGTGYGKSKGSFSVIEARNPVTVLKESEDTYIVEYENIIYVLDPPAKPGQFDPHEETK